MIIIGAMKSGTTSLFNYVSQHPRISQSNPKETFFFGKDSEWKKGKDWFDSHFQFDPLQHEWALEASTDCTMRPHVAGVLRRLQQLQDVEYRFVYLMRHPLRRIESHMRHRARRGLEIGEVTAADWSLDGGIPEIAIDISRYAFQIEPYVTAFGRDHLFLTTLEELEEDSSGVISQIFRFLGLSEFRVNVSNRLNQSSSSKLPPPAWQKLRKITALRTLYRSAVPSALRARIRQKTFLTHRQLGRFDLKKTEESALLEELLPDLRILAHDYEVDVEKIWGIPLN